MPTTEVATYGLIDDANVNDPDNFAAKNMRDGFSIVQKQPGFLKYHLGMQLDKTDAPIIEAMIDWVDKDAHMTWRAHPDHAGVAALSMSIFTDAHFKGGRMLHVDFAPYADLGKACSAPVTEVVTLYFADAPPADYMAGFMRFRDAMFDAAAELGGDEGRAAFACAAGVTHEVVEYEGVRGTAVVAVLGWRSIEHHMQARETGPFKETIHFLRSNAAKVEVHHTAFGYTPGP